MKKYEIIADFSTFTNYFIKIVTGEEYWDEKKINSYIIGIFKKIYFENEKNHRRVKINYFVFWLNYFLENHVDKMSVQTKTSILTIIDKLDLHQLTYTLNINLEELSTLNAVNYYTRRIFDDNTLSDTQIKVITSILEEKNIAFSAPTSYGKSSVVLSSLIYYSSINKAAEYIFVLPTKALVNEYRRKIFEATKLTGCAIEINENPYFRKSEEKRIFHLFTQERFLIYSELETFKCNYVVFDEVQGLLNILNKQEERAVILAKAISIVSNKNIPMIFLMPYIANPVNDFLKYFLGDNKEFTEIKDLHSPTTSNKFLITRYDKEYLCQDVTLNKGFSEKPSITKLDIMCNKSMYNFYDLERELSIICKGLNCVDKKNLCYCLKENISKTAKYYAGEMHEVELINREKALINYWTEYIHPKFELISFLSKGVSIHHADLDTYSKRQIERIFSSKSNLNMLFCTSTLLEGVNLNANNLFFLAKRGKFNNAELDKKNLFGRVGRLGSYLQGNVYKFWVENDCKPDQLSSSIKELNNASDEYKVPTKLWKINENNINDVLKSYLTDYDVESKLSNEYQENKVKISNFDYFIGRKKSQLVDEIIKNFEKEKLIQIESGLYLKTYEDCLFILNTLSEIYDWKNSSNFAEKYRMSNLTYLAMILHNSLMGMPIRFTIDDMIKKNNSHEYSIVICKTSQGREYPKFISEKNRKFILDRYHREYVDSDINLLIYSYIYDMQNIIEFRVKKYLEDLYYRIMKISGKKIEDVEDFLIYTTVNSKRKINLSKLGLLDSFAINELLKYEDLFEGDVPQKERLVELMYKLDDSKPLKYAIEEII